MDRDELKRLINNLYGMKVRQNFINYVKDRDIINKPIKEDSIKMYDVGNLYKCTICGAKFGEKHKRGWE